LIDECLFLGHNLFLKFVPIGIFGCV
jgi:hypothetical protein